MRRKPPALSVFVSVLSLGVSALAAPPVVTVTAQGARIQIKAATVAECIDALSRAAGFKVTYEGARPSTMLFNAEIDTPSVAHTLTRLLEGQNLNYGVVFDLTGTRVTTLAIYGAPQKTSGSSSGSGSAGTRPQPFAPPRNSRGALIDAPPVEESAPEPTPDPAPTPTPTASPVVSPIRPSPFGPRQPFGRPLGVPLATPPPAPTPSPSA